MSTAAAVRKEIPAKTKTYLAFGLWIMEKTMTEEEARNKMIEMFIGCETIDGICEKFEAFNEKEMVEKLVQIHKSLKPKPIKKKKTIESPDNIVNELVSLATNSVPVVPAVPENENVNEPKPTAEKKKRAAPKAKPTEDKAKPTEDKAKPTEDKAKVAPVVENVVVPVVENVVVPVVENVNVVPSVSEVKTSDVKKKRVVKPKAESVVPSVENAVPSATENVVPSESENVVIESIVPSVIENVVPSVVKAPRKKATPKAKPTEEKAASESIVATVTEEKAVTESIVATENVVPSAVNVVKAPKKKATPKAKPTEAKATSENVVPSATTSVSVANENEVVTSEVQASENVVPSNVVPSNVVPSNVVPSNVVPSNVVHSNAVVPVSTEDKKKKPKAEKPKAKAPVAPAVVESPKNDVGAPEEFEDMELVVKEFVYGTKSYYIDEEETIYEQEGLKKIGNLVNGKLVFDSV